MLRTVLMLELRRRLRAPLTWLMFAGLALYTAATMAGGETAQLAGAGVPHNGAFMLQYWSMYSAFWVAVLGPILFTAPALRDLKVRIAPLVFATPIGDGDYFWGKYVASLLVCLIVMLSIPITLLAVSWLHRYGLFGDLLFLPQIPWRQVAQATTLWVLPACVVYGSLHYAMATLSGRPLSSYAFAVLSMGVFTFFFVAFQADGNHRFWIEVIDPMGKQTVDGQALYWSVSERATRLLEAQPTLVANRLGYLALALATLLFARWRFCLPRFLAAGREHRTRRPPAPVFGAGTPVRSHSSVAGDVPAIEVTPQTPFRRVRLALWLGGWHAAVTWRLQVFRIVAAGLVLIGIETGWSAAAEFFNGPENHLLPAAQVLLSVIEPQMFMLIMMVTIYFAGELLARDHDSRIAGLVDSAPLPAGLTQVGHWLAVSLLAVGLSVLPSLATLILQLASGYLEAVPAHFARSAFIHIAPLALTYAWLTCAVYWFSGNRLMSQGLPMAVLWAGVALHEVHAVQQRLFLLGLPADLAFSDFDLLAPSTARHLALGSYFIGVSGLLAALALGWRLRGQVRFSVRRPPAVVWAMLLFASLAVAGGLRVSIQLQRHDWLPSGLARDRQADYEHRYGFLMEQQDLLIRALRLDLQLQPGRGELLADGRWTVINDGKKPLTRLYLSLPDNSRIDRLTLDGTVLDALSEDEHLRVVRYDLPQALAPAQAATIAWRMRTHARGYTYDSSEHRIERGSVVLDPHDLPVLGYDRSRELASNAQRQQRGLPPRRPLLDQPDRFASHPTAGRADLELRVRVPKDFLVGASGQRVAERVDNQWRQTEFRQQNAPLLWLVTAAPVKERTVYWTSRNGRHIAIRLQNLAIHGANEARVLATAEDALTTFEQRFGPYPQTSLEVAETGQFLRDEERASPLVQSAGGFIAMPERTGWLHDDRQEPTYDYLAFVLSREIARAWWGHAAGAATGPGSALIDEGVPGLLALEMLARRHGEPAAESYARLLSETYLKQSALTEGRVPDVLHTQFERYAGLQATLVLYAQRKRLGASVFDARLEDFFRRQAATGPGSVLVQPRDLAYALGLDTDADDLYPPQT